MQNAPREHAILSTFIKLPFVFKICIFSIFEWPFKTGLYQARYFCSRRIHLQRMAHQDLNLIQEDLNGFMSHLIKILTFILPDMSETKMVLSIKHGINNISAFSTVSKIFVLSEEQMSRDSGLVFFLILSLFFSAAKSGSTAIMQELLTKVRKIERIAEVIHSAIQGGHLEIVKLIMEVI